jgi:hypothetical protein
MIYRQIDIIPKYIKVLHNTNFFSYTKDKMFKSPLIILTFAAITIYHAHVISFIIPCKRNPEIY